MTDYLLIAAASVAAAFILFAGILARRKQGWAPAAAALPACLVLGFVLAKAMYEVLMRADYFLQWGEWEVFLDLQPRRMCFTAGAAGVCLGVVLGAKLTGRKPSAVLDCFLLSRPL